MKFVAALVIGLVVLVAPAQARTRYIADITKFAVRSGQGTEFKILATVSSGDTVDTMDEGPEWSRVRLADGREGWVSSRLLTDHKPCPVLLAELRQEQEIVSHPGGVPEEIKRLKAETERLATALSEAEARTRTAAQSYDTLKNDSGQLLKYQADAARLTTALDQANQRAEVLAGEINRLENRQLFRWFLSGAGVLLAGLLLGYGARAKRRRSSLM